MQPTDASSGSSSLSGSVSQNSKTDSTNRGTITTQEIAKGFAWTPWTIVGAVTGFTAGAIYASNLSTDSIITPGVIFGGTVAGMVGAGVGAIGSVVSKTTWLGTQLRDTERKAS